MTHQIARLEGRASIESGRSAERSPIRARSTIGPVRSGGSSDDMVGGSRHRSHARGDGADIQDNCSNTACWFAKRTMMELCSHTENYVFKKCQSYPKSDTRVAHAL